MSVNIVQIPASFTVSAGREAIYAVPAGTQITVQSAAGVATIQYQAPTDWRSLDQGTPSWTAWPLGTCGAGATLIGVVLAPLTMRFAADGSATLSVATVAVSPFFAATTGGLTTLYGASGSAVYADRLTVSVSGVHDNTPTGVNLTASGGTLVLGTDDQSTKGNISGGTSTMDTAVATSHGRTALALTVTPTALTAAQAQNVQLAFTGTLGAPYTVTVPATPHAWLVTNATDNTVNVRVSGQTGITIASGKTQHLFANGTDVVAASVAL